MGQLCATMLRYFRIRAIKKWVACCLRPSQHFRCFTEGNDCFVSLMNADRPRSWVHRLPMYASAQQSNAKNKNETSRCHCIHNLMHKFFLFDSFIVFAQQSYIYVITCYELPIMYYVHGLENNRCPGFGCHTVSMHLIMYYCIHIESNRPMTMPSATPLGVTVSPAKISHSQIHMSAVHRATQSDSFNYFQYAAVP